MAPDITVKLVIRVLVVLSSGPSKNEVIILSSSDINKLTQFSILNCIHLSRRTPSLVLIVIIGYLMVGSSNYKCETFNTKRFYILMQILLSSRERFSPWPYFEIEGC